MLKRILKSSRFEYTVQVQTRQDRRSKQTSIWKRDTHIISYTLYTYSLLYFVTQTFCLMNLHKWRFLFIRLSGLNNKHKNYSTICSHELSPRIPLKAKLKVTTSLVILENCIVCMYRYVGLDNVDLVEFAAFRSSFQA